MNIYSDIREIKNGLKSFEYNSTGFIPTMGALHDGHISLIEKSLNQNDITVVSIYVNPTQFNDPKDLENYPYGLEKDIRILKSMKIDILFTPQFEQLYNDNYRYHINETDFSNELCGKTREGHFTGVLTVVMKLLNIVKPNRVYFGEKDYQQYKLIKGMVEAFHMDIEVISSETIRDTDGLALSSRNLLLNDDERKTAPIFHQLLNSELSDKEIQRTLTDKGFNVDYIQTIDNRRYGAVYLGNIRLIDNVEK